MIGGFSSIGSSGLGRIAAGAFPIEFLCDPAITMRTIGGEMRELLFMAVAEDAKFFAFDISTRSRRNSSINEVSISLP